MSVPLPGSMYARASCAKANSSSNANANCCIGNKFLGAAAFRFSCGSRISSDRPRYLAIKVTPSWLAWTPVPSGADVDSPWYTKSRERFSGSLTAYARIPGAAQGSALGSAARHPLENRAEKYIDDNLANGRAGQNSRTPHGYRKSLKGQFSAGRPSIRLICDALAYRYRARLNGPYCRAYRRMAG